MTLELDDRQRAMLLEMGVRVWLPGTAFAVQPDANARPDAATRPAPVAKPGAFAPRSDSATPPVSSPAQSVGTSAAQPGTQAPRPTAQSAGQARSEPVPRPGHPPGRPVPPGGLRPGSEAQAPGPKVAQPVDLQWVATLDWSALQQAAASCQACGLCAGRKRTTLQAPGGLDAVAFQADWMVVGDVPEEAETLAGSAFVDAGGVLLGNMLKAIAVRRINEGPNAGSPPADAATAASPGAAAGPLPPNPRQAAYVTNVVKCHPGLGNMVQDADLAQCAAWLHREIALVQPKIILAMGRFANQLLLGETPELVSQPLGKLRGRLYHYQGIPVVVTYHPNALMRNTADKAKAWADLCLAADTVDALYPPSVPTA